MAISRRTRTSGTRKRPASRRRLPSAPAVDPAQCEMDPDLRNLTPRRFVKVRFARCPIRLSLGVLARKWSLLILRDIGVYRVDRFNRLLESLDGISPKVLSTRLRQLESEGLLRKVETRRSPKLVRWDLTERSRDLVPVMMMMGAFHSKWDPDVIHPGRRRMRLSELYDREAMSLLRRML